MSATPGGSNNMEGNKVPAASQGNQKSRFSGLHQTVIQASMSHLEPEENCKATLVGSEKVRSFCQVKEVVSLLSGLDEEKKNIIKSAGFDGLLKLPLHDNLDDSLSLWLYRHLDTDSMTLKTPQGVDLQLKDVDVRLIVGIPNGPRKVRCDKQVSGEVVTTVRSLLFGDNPNGSFTMQFLEELIKRDYLGKMCVEEKVAFKIAVVLYALAKFLAPSKDTSIFPMSILSNFTVPEDIVKFNWCEYLLKKLKEGADQVKTMQVGSNEEIKIYGCAFLLQVFYLDNLEFGLHTALHMHIPRCHLFEHAYMKQLIDLEKLNPTATIVDNYGKNKIRAKEEVCYTRGLMVLNLPEFQRGDAKYEESLIILQHLMPTLQDPSSPVAVALKQVGIDCATAIKFGYGPNYPLLIPKKEEGSNNDSAIGPSDAVTIVGNALKKIQRAPATQGHAGPSNARASRLSVSSKAQPQYDESPFDIGYYHPDVPRPHKMRMYGWIREGNASFAELSSTWFIHKVPSPIKLTGHDLITCFTMSGMFSYDLCDAIMRLFGQLDDWVYDHFNSYNKVKHWRWRHFLPASFSRAVMHRDKGYLNSPELEAEFIGPHLKYNVADCAMLIVPVMFGGRWSCYFWDFQRKKTIVLDPTMMTLPPYKPEFYHDGFVDEVTDALFACFEKLFSGWKNDKDEWSREYPTHVGPKCRTANSGLNALHYARAFSGDELAWKLLPGTDGNLAEPRAEFLYSLLKMKGNEGSVPPGLLAELNNVKRRRLS